MYTTPHVPDPAKPDTTYSYVTPATDGRGHLILFDADGTIVQLFFRVTVRPDGTRTNRIFARENSPSPV